LWGRPPAPPPAIRGLITTGVSQAAGALMAWIGREPADRVGGRFAYRQLAIGVTVRPVVSAGVEQFVTEVVVLIFVDDVVVGNLI
jgi:hypothetical protein